MIIPSNTSMSEENFHLTKLFNITEGENNEAISLNSLPKMVWTPTKYKAKHVLFFPIDLQNLCIALI